MPDIRLASLFTCLVYVSTSCVPIAHLRQNKPFSLLYLGHAQIISPRNAASVGWLCKRASRSDSSWTLVGKETRNLEDKTFSVLSKPSSLRQRNCAESNDKFALSESINKSRKERKNCSSSQAVCWFLANIFFHRFSHHVWTLVTADRLP